MNWFARPEGSNYFKREWCKNKKPPHDATFCRAYDKAGTEPSEVNPYPDFTASIKMARDRDGYYYIQGSFHPDFKDDESEILGKFRKRAGARDKLILKQAVQDGTDCTIVVAKDPGSAGLTEYEDFAKRFVAEGFVVKADPMPNTKSKLTRFSPFASACENGLVFIDEESFGSKANLEDFYKEMEAFNGERSTSTRKDERPDICASAFNFISKKKPFLPLKPRQALPSKKKEHLG